MKSYLNLALLPLLAAASPMINVATIHNEAAPVLSSTNSKEIPNSYIIVFKDHVTNSLAAQHHDWVQDVHAATQNQKNELRRKRSQMPFLEEVFSGLKHTIHIPNALLGYSGHFDDDVIEQIRRHPDVSAEE
jgi:cerevisin